MFVLNIQHNQYIKNIRVFMVRCPKFDGQSKFIAQHQINRLIFFAAIFFWISLNAYSQDGNGENGTLRKFEQSIKISDRSSSGNSTQSGSRGQSSNTSGSSIIGDVFTELIDEMGRLTMHRLGKEADPDYQRTSGDLLIPFLRYDYSYQGVAENIHATANRVEAGYGPFGLQIEEYVFKESAPASTMSVTRQLLLYRISPAPIMELDIGLGSTVISGAQSITLSSFALPVKIPFNKNFAMEFVPVWSSSMKDYEIALHMGKGNFGSFRVGYRSLSTPEMALDGPFAGFAIYY